MNTATQLPYNLAYNEASVLKNQTVGAEKNLNILEAAARLNIGIFTSIPLFQGQLLRASIPDYGGLNDQVAKLIQIIRSSPSVIAPLIGQKNQSMLNKILKSQTFRRWMKHSTRKQVRSC